MSPPFFLENDQHLCEKALREVGFRPGFCWAKWEKTLRKMIEGRKLSLNPIAKVLNSLMVQLEIWEQ